MKSELLYADFLLMRRVRANKTQESPIVTYKKTDPNSDEYYIEMSINGQVYYTVAEGADGTDFKTKRIGFCNKLLKGDVVELESHDFSDDSKWRYGTKNSLYKYTPISGKVLIPRRFKIIVDKTDSIGENQTINFAIWQTVYGQVPTFGFTGSVATGTSTTVFDLQTDEGDNFFDGDHIGITISGTEYFRKVFGAPSGDTITIDEALPSTPSANDIVNKYTPTPLPTQQTYTGGQSTGWHHAHPQPRDKQEVDVWVYFASGVPLYKVSVFKYADIKSIRMKSTDEKILDNTHIMYFDYAQFDNDISLCHCWGERIESFLSDHIKITPTNSGEEHRLTIMFKSMDEW